jgi:hypothetical protein
LNQGAGNVSPWLHRRAALRKRFPRTAAAARYLRPTYRRRQKRFEGLEPTDIFQKIYRDNHWQSSETRSGLGSTLSATSTLRDQLPGVLREVGGRSLLDIPCGDFHWMSHVDLSGVDEYIGADIVPDLIDELRNSFGDDRHQFVRLDLCQDTLPHVDVILCRDVFLHLSNRYISDGLANVIKARPSYFLASNYPDTTRNVDVQTGMARPVNLCLPPFGLPLPEKVIDDPGVHADRRVLGLWSLEQLEHLKLA